MCCILVQFFIFLLSKFNKIYLIPHYLPDSLFCWVELNKTEFQIHCFVLFFFRTRWRVFPCSTTQKFAQRLLHMARPSAKNTVNSWRIMVIKWLETIFAEVWHWWDGVIFNFNRKFISIIIIIIIIIFLYCKILIFV